MLNLVSVKKIFRNKVALYLLSRYTVLILQFISSIYIASKLGPNLFGTWGFALMIISYFSYFNLGIDKSLNVLFIQNRENHEYSKSLVANAFILIFIICLIVIGLSVILFFSDIPTINKFELGKLFLLIPAIVTLYHLNSIMGTVYRIKNRLFELAIFQSIIPILIFLTMFFANGKKLLATLIWATFFGHIISLAIFLINKKTPLDGLIDFKTCKKLLNKAIFLFLFNVSFYLIILSTRSIISYYYSVEKFGNFTFGYTIANAILLLLQAVSIIIYPKVIDRLKTSDKSKI